MSVPGAVTPTTEDTPPPCLPYTYSPIVDRPRIRWPDGARVAFWVGVNIESFPIGIPSTSIAPVTAALTPDPLNYGWREYGPRVGIWRTMDLLDRYGIRASVPLNSEACEQYQRIIEEGQKRQWVWLAHGKNHPTKQAGMAVDAEREYLRTVIDTITGATGAAPHGWLGPSLSESFSTPSLLAELGVQYICDWCNDDQPYPITVTEGRMISVPYSIEVNDLTLCVGKNFTGPEFCDVLIDQFDTLWADSESTGRVMAVGLHPFITGQPFRQKHLARALEHITSHHGVWVTTSDDIAAWYYQHQYDATTTGEEK
jgi:allantoinase